MTVNIGTDYWPQPKGFEHWSWTAWDEDAEPDDLGAIPFANGPTRQSAIDALWEQLERDA